jgi:hypothetical protein
MFKSPVTKKRSNAIQEDVTTVEKVHIRHDDRTDSKIVAKKERRSRGPRDLASLSMTFREADYSHHTLANGAGTYLVQSHRPRTDPQITWRSRLKKAKDASTESWSEYVSWKNSESVQVSPNLQPRDPCGVVAPDGGNLDDSQGTKRRPNC